MKIIGIVLAVLIIGGIAVFALEKRSVEQSREALGRQVQQELDKIK